MTNMTEAVRVIDSPIGRIILVAKNEKLVSLRIEGSAAAGLDAAELDAGDFGKAEVLDEAANKLASYFAGESKDLSVPIEFEGTEFQRSVWRQIAAIGYGETKTYAEIANAIGNPKASRAVGGAVGANPIALIVGCHRVLGASGKITGFSGGDGLPTKRWLLALEGLKAKE
jgi:methylated-DNA-[protein]-cysteine S-methyltransferase